MREETTNKPGRRLNNIRWPLGLTFVLALVVALLVPTLGSPVRTTSAQTDEQAIFASPAAVDGSGNDEQGQPSTTGEAQSVSVEQDQNQAGNAGTDQPIAPAGANADGAAVTSQAATGTGTESEPQSSAGITPPAPSLTYTPAAQPRCKPSGDDPEEIAQGDHLDYTCSYRVALSGEQVAPAAIQLNWRVDAAVGGGWRVQLKPLPPGADPDNPPPWTADPSPDAALEQQGPIGPSPAASVSDLLNASAEWTFKVRVFRVACGTETQPVTLTLAVAAALPGIDGEAVTMGGPNPEPFTLNPALAPIPEPSVSFSGALDFGNVAVDATGVETPPKPQTITVTVSGLDQACGAWRLGLKATPLDAAKNVTIDASNLHLSSIDDQPIAAGGCPLSEGCLIAVIPAGPTADPTATYNLGVSLVLPDQPRAATFNATLMASLTEVSS